MRETLTKEYSGGGLSAAVLLSPTLHKWSSALYAVAISEVRKHKC